MFKELEHLPLGVTEGRAEQKEAGAVLIDWHSDKVFDSFLFGGFADVLKYLKVENFNLLDLLRGGGIVHGRDIAFFGCYLIAA